METTTENTSPQTERYSYVSEPYSRQLPREITPEEELAIGREVAEKNATIDDLLIREAKLADEKREAAKAREELEEECRALTRFTHHGAVDAAVMCRSYHDVARMAVLVKREDTGEIVEDRPMTAEEQTLALNPPLPLPDPEPRANSPEDLGYALGKDAAEELLEPGKKKGRKRNGKH